MAMNIGKTSGDIALPAMMIERTETIETIGKTGHVVPRRTPNTAAGGTRTSIGRHVLIAIAAENTVVVTPDHAHQLLKTGARTRTEMVQTPSIVPVAKAGARRTSIVIVTGTDLGKKIAIETGTGIGIDETGGIAITTASMITIGKKIDHVIRTRRGSAPVETVTKKRIAIIRTRNIGRHAEAEKIVIASETANTMNRNQPPLSVPFPHP